MARNVRLIGINFYKTSSERNMHGIPKKVPTEARAYPGRISRTPLKRATGSANEEPGGPSVADVLNELSQIIKSRVVISEPERIAVVLWIAHTYIFDRFKHTPRLLVTSADAAMGKSELLRLVAALSAGGEKIDGITPSSLRRIGALAKDKTFTLCLDQLDSLNDENERDTEILNLLCSSTEVGATAIMSERGTGSGSIWVPTRFRFGVPTALGKIKLLPGSAIMSRCILINMLPETPAERAKQMPERQKPIPELRAQLASALSVVKAEYIKAPDGIPSRMEDVWQPLLAVAKAGGERWLEMAERALVELHSAWERSDPPPFALLRRAAASVKNWPHPQIFRGELHRLLRDNRGEPQQTRLLTAAGLRIGTVRRGGDLKRGYYVVEIKAAAERLPAIPE